MEQQRMIELRDGGLTLQEIADAANASVGVVFRMTGGRKGKQRRPYKKRPLLNVERDRKICEMVTNKGVRQTEAAQIFDLTKGRVSQIVKAGDNGDG